MRGHSSGDGVTTGVRNRHIYEAPKHVTMRALDPRIVRDVLTGLAPTAAATCPRCHASTRALANGRGRLDICDACGTLELRSSEGVDLLRLQAWAPGDMRASMSSLRLR